jgi:cytochrome c oxidase cbb3-type subunit III
MVAKTEGAVFGTRDSTPPADTPPAPALTKDAEIVGVYDGIEEQNHPLPRWWKWTFLGAPVFALLYWFTYQGLHARPSVRERYIVERDAELALRAQSAFSKGQLTGDVLVGLSKDPAMVSKGQAVFTTTCAACHRADGGGNIGPNLTDEYWLHGGKPEDIYKTVHEGVVAKGMPAWAPVLGDEKVADAVAYVLTLRDTRVAGGKAPQGEKEE